MSRRADYLALATICLVVAGILASIAVGDYQIAVQLHPRHAHSLLIEPAMYAVYGLAMLAVLFILAGLLQLPLPPWKRPEFPRVRIEVVGTGRHTDNTEDNFDLWFWWELRLTNYELEREADLHFEVRIPLARSSNMGARFGETIFTRPKDKPPPEVPGAWSADPIHVPSGRSVPAMIVQCVRAPWSQSLEETMTIRLLVEDPVSETAVVFDPFKWSTGPDNFESVERRSDGSFRVFPWPDDAPNASSTDPDARVVPE
jgi:hypothetical protein